MRLAWLWALTCVVACDCGGSRVDPVDASGDVRGLDVGLDVGDDAQLIDGGADAADADVPPECELEDACGDFLDNDCDEGVDEVRVRAARSRPASAEPAPSATSAPAWTG